MTFLEAVTRIMRNNALLRGDTDAPSSFTDTNHNASLQIAQVAIQDELTNLAADRLIPYEKASTSVGLTTGTRLYSLPGDFTNFYGYAHFYDSTDNRIIPQYPGGLERLQLSYPQYSTERGAPNWWYWEPGTTKKVGFYQIPNSSYNGRTLTYDYERSILVTDATDTMPFHNLEENNTFCIAAGRRFKFMYEDVDNKADIQAILDSDVSYRTARATLMKLITGTNPSRYWAHSYR